MEALRSHGMCPKSHRKCQCWDLNPDPPNYPVVPLDPIREVSEFGLRVI